MRPEAVSVTGAMPVPISVADCGLLPALSVTESVAVLVPVANGEKVTVILQLAPVARVEPHVLVSEKSPVFAPVKLMLEIVSDEPGFWRVMDTDGLVVPSGWAAKVTLPGLKVTGAAPLPVSDTDCVPLPALSVSVREAVREPIARGVNVTLIVQLAEGAKVPAHVAVSAKLVGFVPVSAIFFTSNGTVPVFFSVTFCAELVVPTN